MLRRVLVMNKEVDGKTQTKGLLSLEVGNSLSGRLRVFDIEKEDVNLIVKIGANTLVFDNITEPENFAFETVYHSLDTPICAVVADRSSVFAYGKTEGFEGDYTDLIKELEQSPESSTERQQDYIKDSLINDDEGYDTQGEEVFLDSKKEKNKEDFSEESSEEFEIPYRSHIQTKNKKSKNDLSEDVEDAENFFEMVQAQVDELFSKSEHFTQLESLIEDTEWIKVPYLSEDNDHYIVGKIFSEGEITHLCYGVPAENKNVAPPINLAKYSQWLPLDVHNSDSAGYWIMYQDAQTGENLELNF